MANVQNIAEVLTQRIPSGYAHLLRMAASFSAQTNTRTALVGGVVRDLMLDRPIKDIDLLVDHPAKGIAQYLAESLKGRVVFHEPFWTYVIQWGEDHRLDVVTAREESYPAPAKLPVVKPSRIEQDLKRRDFAVNAMALWLTKENYGDVLDPFEGAKDVKQGLIRILHNKSFQDDPTRIFRAARFAGRLGFSIEKNTRGLLDKAVQERLPDLLTPVRKRHEFELVLKEKNPIPALRFLETWDSLKFFHPDWDLRNIRLDELEKYDDRIDLQHNFMRRLIQWFQPFGRMKAGDMLKELCFERPVKKAILEGM